MLCVHPFQVTAVCRARSAPCLRAVFRPPRLTSAVACPVATGSEPWKDPVLSTLEVRPPRSLEEAFQMGGEGVLIKRYQEYPYIPGASF